MKAWYNQYENSFRLLTVYSVIKFKFLDDLIVDAVDDVKEADGFFADAAEAIDDVKEADGFFTDAAEAIDDTIDAVTDSIEDAYDDASNWVQDAIESAGEALGDAAEAITNVFKKSENDEL